MPRKSNNTSTKAYSTQAKPSQATAEIKLRGDPATKAGQAKLLECLQNLTASYIDTHHVAIEERICGLPKEVQEEFFDAIKTSIKKDVERLLALPEHMRARVQSRHDTPKKASDAAPVDSTLTTTEKRTRNKYKLIQKHWGADAAAYYKSLGLQQNTLTHIASIAIRIAGQATAQTYLNDQVLLRMQKIKEGKPVGNIPRGQKMSRGDGKTAKDRIWALQREGTPLGTVLNPHCQQLIEYFKLRVSRFSVLKAEDDHGSSPEDSDKSDACDDAEESDENGEAVTFGAHTDVQNEDSMEVDQDEEEEE
ncbi:hypothetical protein IWX49DRAFT_557633 [Phyllosticta citricarpa]|uniref:Uncharacterized protein n=2 Tax=Phyllosticta TaxID=121621 RepID=A0ABR1L9V1_9PEZI